jgi:hypothetical protein
VLHELGHELGLDDVRDPAYTGLMSAGLPADTRRLPAIDAAAVDRLFSEDLAELAQALAADWLAGPRSGEANRPFLLC